MSSSLVRQVCHSKYAPKHHLACAFACLAFLIAGCEGGTRTGYGYRIIPLPPTVEPEPVNLSDPRLIQDPPESILEQFRVDAEGYITDGPRYLPDEPIDYTDLMTNEEIAQSFSKVVFGTEAETFLKHFTGETNSYDESLRNKVFKFERKLAQAMIYLNGELDDEFRRSLSQSIILIEENTGRTIPFLVPTEGYVYLAYYFVNDQADMQIIADSFRKQSDQNPADPENRAVLLSMATLFENSVKRNLTSCYALPTFSADDSRTTTLVVFFLNIPPKYLNACAFEETVQSMGLFSDDDSLFSSMFTDSFKVYLRPTQLDWMMLRILYDERIKNGMTREEAMPIVRDILAETRPHGEP